MFYTEQDNGQFLGYFLWLSRGVFRGPMPESADLFPRHRGCLADTNQDGYLDIITSDKRGYLVIFLGGPEGYSRQRIKKIPIDETWHSQSGYVLIVIITRLGLPIASLAVTARPSVPLTRPSGPIRMMPTPTTFWAYPICRPRDWGTRNQPLHNTESLKTWIKIWPKDCSNVFPNELKKAYQEAAAECSVAVIAIEKERAFFRPAIREERFTHHIRESIISRIRPRLGK